MFATIRRYESVDETRTSELVKKVDEGLTPKLSESPGFHGYYLVNAGDGVFISVGIFENAEQAEESTQVASIWVRDAELDGVLPNKPKVTSGEIVVEKASELVQA